MPNSLIRGLWTASALLLSMIIGIIGGVLAWLGGDNAPNAVMSGAATFAATMTLAVLILTFLGAGDRPRSGQRRRGIKR
jgi:hypothetical protein